MSSEIKKFKDIVGNMVGIGNSDLLISDTDVDKAIEDLYSIRDKMGIKISEAEKVKARNELLANIKVRLEPGVAIVPTDHKKWFEESKNEIIFEYWDRFKTYLAQDKGIELNVISKMDKVSDQVVDLLGDPRREEEEQRRGLIIGDVQSGKTINYSGIICKAVDAGFRIVILMTGTTNDLRSQTQIRLDEAFLGIDTRAAAKGGGRVLVGAGKYNPIPTPIAFTSVEKDFSISAVRQMTTSLSKNANDKPMLFVIKKNVSVLKNLLEWMESSGKYGDQKIDNSVLVIDDEADYASINTKIAGSERSKTNYLIEKILNMYRFASYSGFTATPYANIFIDPETDEELNTEGLFPKDYIYSLNSPDTYIGARNIFPKNATYHFILRDIEDGEEFYPSKHKKDDDFSVLSESLKKAVRTFLIANVIRDLRGDKTEHRSMMINVTRFINTQKLVRKAVADYVGDIKRSIKTYAFLPQEKALLDEELNLLSKTFADEYSSLDFSWEQIQVNLFGSVNEIEVLATYGGGDDLNYHENPDGLRAIVVGGMRLSRGLTLEGLIVTYIYRNSMAYDTLMQMGRWFGYRPNYGDICRIWMDKNSQDWYEYISDATDELRAEVKRMRDIESTPLDFGLKVRNDTDMKLTITARNKMRTAKEKSINVSLSKAYIETAFIHNDAKKNKANLAAVSNLINSTNFDKSDNQYIAEHVDKNLIVRLLETIDMPPTNVQFDPLSVANFIEQYAGDELNDWNVAIKSGDHKKTYTLPNGISINPNDRLFELIREDCVVRMNRRRLGSQGDAKTGLNIAQLELVKEIVTSNPNRNSSNINDKDYFAISRKPLLQVYFIQPRQKSEDWDRLAEFDSIPLIGFSVGIPPLGDIKTRNIRYQINKIHQDFGGIEEFEDE
ncbi:MAG: Z1 domain-containing protein [bacterium]